ncbi:hypothetical protein J132_01950 [Termitomyces sp. J132]|nr:hypothetical protein J132_01950 [Termitomyces sp. J132]
MSALSTTAGDVLDAHANLLPIDLLFCKVLVRAAVCLSSLPPSHPLFKPVHSAARHCVCHHCSPLHSIFSFTDINPSLIETVLPTHQPPSYKPAFTMHIKPNKESALMAIQRVHSCSWAAVYCDGSGYEGGIGASAALFIDNEKTTALQYHLGSASEHTVYEAEVVGFTFGLHLLMSITHQLCGLTTIGSNSQAAIWALNNQRPHPAHYVLDLMHSAAESLHKKQDHLQHSQQC